MEAVVAAAGACNTLANYRLEAGARPGDSKTTAAKDKQAVARERRPLPLSHKCGRLIVLAYLPGRSKRQRKLREITDRLLAIRVVVVAQLKIRAARWRDRFRPAAVVRPAAAGRLLCHDCDHLLAVGHVAAPGAFRRRMTAVGEPLIRSAEACPTDALVRARKRDSQTDGEMPGIPATKL